MNLLTHKNLGFNIFKFFKLSMYFYNKYLLNIEIIDADIQNKFLQLNLSIAEQLSWYCEFICQTVVYVQHFPFRSKRARLS